MAPVRDARLGFRLGGLMRQSGMWRLVRVLGFAAILIGAPGSMAADPVHADNQPGEWVARIGGTDREGAWVRGGPGTEYPAAFSLPDGTVVRVIAEPTFDADGRCWNVVALG